MTQRKRKDNGFQLEEKEDFVIDLVCGMELTAKNVGFKSEYLGKTYYFCSQNCKEHFDNNPEKYAE